MYLREAAEEGITVCFGWRPSPALCLRKFSLVVFFPATFKMPRPVNKVSSKAKITAYIADGKVIKKRKVFTLNYVHEHY